jgi:hypothetical protein
VSLADGWFGQRFGRVIQNGFNFLQKARMINLIMSSYIIQRAEDGHAAAHTVCAGTDKDWDQVGMEVK